jgi:hypothetical protein
MVPYDGTPIKEELVRAGRLRGDVCNPDYDFLDPRLAAFYQELTDVVSLKGWIHGLEAVTIQLATAWHEVAVMERLFPALQGMPAYRKTLSAITSRSNEILLGAVDDLVQAHEGGRESALDSSRLEAGRRQILDDLLAERDAFVYRHQEQLLAALGDTRRPAGNQTPARTAATA